MSSNELDYQNTTTTNKAIEASGTYAQQATSSVHNFTNGVAKGAAGLLQYSPILPIGQMKALV